MKSGFPCMLAVWSLLTSLDATPNRTISVEERIIGTNAEGYAVLRTEKDNLGSYYSYRTKTWLDELPKDRENDPEPKSTLLLDATYTVDIEDKNTEPAVKEAIHHQDTELPLASVLQRYPARPSDPWTQEKLAKLEIHPVAGVNFERSVGLIQGDVIARIFGKQVESVEWSLGEVTEDTNTIFLQLIKDADEGARETRIACIPPAITKLARDKAALKPLYLIAGKFPTLEEALKKRIL